MEIYKKGQAKNYRVAFAAVAAILSLYASYSWFTWLYGDSLFGQDWLRIDWIGAAIILAGGLLCAFWLAFVNRKSVDYVVTTEEEMRKVTWPTRDELVSSSIIVVVVMVVLGIVTTVFDLAFVQILNILKKFIGG